MPRQSTEKQPHPSSQSLSLKKSWTLWEWWVGIMAIAQLIGLGIGFVASAITNSIGIEHAATVFYLVGLLEGIVLGVAQWLVLRRYVKRINAWVIVTAIAVPFVTVVVEALFNELFAVLPLWLVQIVAWVVLGFAYLMIFGAFMSFVFGQAVWDGAKSHLLADAIGGVFRFLFSWPLLLVWAALAIYFLWWRV